MNRSRIAGLRVLIIACVLAGLVVVILDAAGVKDWRAKAGAALAAAVVTVLGNVMQTSLNSMLNKRAELTEERAKRIFMPRGRLPRVKEIADPISIGVRPASPRPLAERQPAQHQPTQHQPDGRGDRVPVYVHRDVDPPLRQALAGRGFVLLVGDATAGKTRTAFEAMKAMLPEHVFISPSVLVYVASAVSAAAAARRCVLWLDNLPLFLGPDGLTRKSIAELMDGTDHHRVILATMRATDESRLIVAGAESGEQVMHISQGVIDQADHRFFVERLLSPSEAWPGRGNGPERIPGGRGHQSPAQQRDRGVPRVRTAALHRMAGRPVARPPPAGRGPDRRRGRLPPRRVRRAVAPAAPGRAALRLSRAIRGQPGLSGEACPGLGLGGQAPGLRQRSAALHRWRPL